MIKYLFFTLLFFQAEVPLKPNEEFEIKLDYKFRQRSASQDTHHKVDYDETRSEYERRTSTSLLPYLTLNIKPLKLSLEEIRLKGIASDGKLVLNKKILTGDVIKMDLGFTDDLKDHVGPHEYNLFFVSNAKKEISRIHLLVKEDGTFLVNDQVKGKF